MYKIPGSIVLLKMYGKSASNHQQGQICKTALTYSMLCRSTADSLITPPYWTAISECYLLPGEARLWSPAAAARS